MGNGQFYGFYTLIFESEQETRPVVLEKASNMITRGKNEKTELSAVFKST